MRLTYVPLLAEQRELYHRPRDFKRFKVYLHMTIDFETNLYRVAHVHEHGHAKTLRDLMEQEGRVMARAGCEGPALDPEDIEYTRHVIAPLLDATDRLAAVVVATFGDGTAADDEGGDSETYAVTSAEVRALLAAHAAGSSPWPDGACAGTEPSPT